MPVLDIHAASDDERREICRNVYDVWRQGLTIEEHVSRRMESVQHHRAVWFAGCVNGRVVTSLGVYPTAFRLHGKVVPGIAVAAVHTIAACRGRGYAPAMIRWIEEYYRRKGVVLSLLYSDIDPNYYARLGYLRCPSLCGSVDLSALSDLEKEETGRLRLHELSGTDARMPFAEQYNAAHAELPLSIERNDDYWNFLFQKDATDRFFAVGEISGQCVGYVRLGRKPVSTVDGQPDGYAITIRDLALPDDSPETWSGLINAIVRMASNRASRCECVRIEGWFPGSAVSSARVSLTPREDEITMLKPLASRITLDEPTIASAEHFHEIDHV